MTLRYVVLVVWAITLCGPLTAQGLHEAAGAGDVARVQSLITRGTDVNAVDANHRTALHVAAQNGQVEVMKVLMAAGADRHARDDRSREPMAFAMDFRDVGVRGAMVALLQSGAADFKPRESDPWTLHSAAIHGEVSVGRMLISLGADVNAVGSNSNRPLNLACLKGNADFVRLLLDHGVQVNARASDGVTALHDAALGGNPEIAGLLLSAGAEIDARDTEMDATPLYYAAALGKEEFAIVLIHSGASTTAVAKSGKSILQAATENHLTKVTDLLRR